MFAKRFRLEPSRLSAALVAALVMPVAGTMLPATLISPLLATNAIPVEGIALLFAVDVVPDIFATTTNVTADMVAATIVSRRELHRPQSN